MLKKYLLLALILFWSILLFILEIISYEPFIEFINIIIGTVLTGFISYNSISNSDDTNIFNAIVGLINILLGVVFIILNFSYINSTIILLIGGQLIGITIAKILKKQKSTHLSASTKRPEPIEPEPGPEPRPF